jgi:ectoine hydroxylase-related dioxygenase (phytanoyl-CoA dioxygenase family)
MDSKHSKRKSEDNCGDKSPCDGVAKRQKVEVGRQITKDEGNNEDKRKLAFLKALEQGEKDLKEKGYTVLEGVLTPEEVQVAKEAFHDWYGSNEQIGRLHRDISPHGIIKHFEVGHQRHAWLVRTNPFVKAAFKHLWETGNLVSSYDGCCYLPADCKKKDTNWTHTDQAPCKEGLLCYQGFVALTSNEQRTLVVYEGSHNLHHAYGKRFGVTDTKNWHKIDEEYLKELEGSRRVLSVKAGSLVIWDSRTFHQNQYGNEEKKRLVQYVSYLPKSGRSEKQREKRMKYCQERRTTSHWAYPVSVNGLQPQNYGDKSKVIDYTALRKPNLEGLMPAILKLI